MTPNIYKFNIGADFTLKAAQAIEGFINAQSDETVRIALSGGNSPKAVYKKLSQSQLIDWSKIELYQVDERYVPSNTMDSNARLISETLTDETPNLKAFHAFDTSDSIEHALVQYERILEKLSFPHFDLVVLGLGKDGHTASLFPHGPELKITDRLVLHSRSPEGIKDRLSLSFSAIMSSQKIIFLIKGADKMNMVKRWLESDTAIEEIPAKAILEHPNVDIFYDYSE